MGGDFDTLFQNVRQRIKFTMLSTKAIIEKSLGVGGQEIECECIVCAHGKTFGIKDDLAIVLRIRI